MKTYDNNGNLGSEISTSYTSDGLVITTNTVYNTYHPGQVISQNVQVRDLNTGKLSSRNLLGGKLLP
jgi:phage gpG-like protein